jgi:phage-related protein
MTQRELVYVGRSERDLQAFPEEVQDVAALALLEAMDGHKHQDAKPLKGFGGAGVLEICESFRTDEYRIVYTTKFEGVVYVLHAFKKKSRRGIATPRQDMETIRRRFKVAADLHDERTPS